MSIKSKRYIYLSFAFFLTLVLATSLNAQDKEENRIEWSVDRQLEWTDFKAKPDYSDYRIAAITASLIQYKYFCEDGYIQFSSKAMFISNESWVKPDNKNLRTLEHERLHFDITEFFNRLLLKKVAQKNWKCSETKELEKLVNEVLEEWRLAQKRYDKDTWFSLNSKMQNEWNNLVRERLSYEQNE